MHKWSLCLEKLHNWSCGHKSNAKMVPNSGKITEHVLWHKNIAEMVPTADCFYRNGSYASFFYITTTVAEKDYKNGHRRHEKINCFKNHLINHSEY